MNEHIPEHVAIEPHELPGAVGDEWLPESAEKPMGWHTQMSVATALQMTNFQLLNTFGQAGEEVRSKLAEMAEAGQVWIDTEGCNNYDPVTHKCLGHPVGGATHE